MVQLAGYIAEQTAYHHGEVSLHHTIINMAQDFVGSNNVPLLTAGGQFGTRAQGGNDYASPRYIFTSLSPLSRYIFPQADDGQLEHLTEDGSPVEPKFYIPIIPFLLVNGSQGIGTGWSCFVPPHNTLHLVDHVKRRVRGESAGPPLVPWIRGFKGKIIMGDSSLSPSSKDRDTLYTYGVVKQSEKSLNNIEVTELPYGRWTEDFKDQLIVMHEKGLIRGFTEHHSANNVKFEIAVSRPQRDALEIMPGVESLVGLICSFRLEGKISMRNMHCYDRNGQIKRYKTAEDICADHFEIRLEAYERRKKALAAKFQIDAEVARNKCRFVTDILNGNLEIIGPSTSSSSSARQASSGSATVPLALHRVAREGELLSQMRRMGYSSLENLEMLSGKNSSGSGSGSGSGATEEGASRTKKASSTKGSFGYLLDMPIHSLTEERVVSLRGTAEEANAKLKALLATSEKDLWMRDLDALEVHAEAISR